MSEKELMPWAQDEANDFYRRYGFGNCSCHIAPPCNSCIRPGNPSNLECTEDAWGTPSEVMLAEASEELPRLINDLAARHLKEMRESWRAAA